MREPRDECEAVGFAVVVVHRDVPDDPHEHETDGRSCWCVPDVHRVVQRELRRWRE